MPAMLTLTRSLPSTQVSKPPNRFTPEFQVYKKYKGWEIRRQVLAHRGVPI